MKNKTAAKVSLIILFSFVLVTSAVAQSGRGKARANGIVTDEAGNPVPNAKVVLDFLGKDQVTFETSTNNKGVWSMLGLGTGMWRVTVTAEGYSPAAVEQMLQQLERNPRIEVELVKLQYSEAPVIEDDETLEILTRGNELFDDEKYDEALLAYQEFLALNPQAYQIGFNIADCYREKEEYAAAIAEYTKVLENTSQEDEKGKELSAKALAGIGECYLKQDDFENAQSYFKKSVDTYSENELIAYNVGEIYFSHQSLDEALHYFTLANEIKPEWGDPLYKIGLVYLNMADYEKAKINLNKFLTVEPDTARAESVKNILTQLK